MKTKHDLIENYENNTSEIKELKSYFNGIVPHNYKVRIQFNSSDNVDLMVYEKLNDSSKLELLFRKWDLDLSDYVEVPQTEYESKYHGKTNSLDLVKKKLNWTDQTFIEIREKLSNADCIGIVSGNPTAIDYGFKGMGKFGYLIFDEQLDNEQQEKYSDDCMLLFYKDNVVLKYGSGATGSLCTPEFARTK
ncbi:hypothetical protein GCM10028895_28620 [Pontibacter rugosus]